MEIISFLQLTQVRVAGVADDGLPHGPGPVPAGQSDLPPHHRQLRLDCPGSHLYLEGETKLLGEMKSKYINNLLERSLSE